ncbi:PaaX family transcriptional regulator C-terminal domain-containing protein [Streptomyces showdoensis]|uniref:PaaX family transcriptional regulator C-terminal domain-containing protein n=1 Tax=Streptomyces showdoensis TaxID=68268 RepID=UPI0031EA4252
MEPDPLLPPELLPRPWQGAAARAPAAECRREPARLGDDEGDRSEGGDGDEAVVRRGCSRSTGGLLSE